MIYKTKRSYHNVPKVVKKDLKSCLDLPKKMPKSFQEMPKVAKRYEKFIKVGKICQHLPKDNKSGQISNLLSLCSAVEKIEDQQFNDCIIQI